MLTVYDIASIEVTETQRVGTLRMRRLVLRNTSGESVVLRLYSHSPVGLMLPHEEPAGLTDQDRRNAEEASNRG